MYTVKVFYKSTDTGIEFHNIDELTTDAGGFLVMKCGVNAVAINRDVINYFSVAEDIIDEEEDDDELV